MSAAFLPRAAHETGHTYVAARLGATVTRVTLSARGGGLTSLERSLGHSGSILVALGGLAAERLLLTPAEVSVTRSRLDFSNAVAHAFAIARIGEAARLRASGLDTLTDEELDLAADLVVERYRVRALKLIDLAAADVAALLGANLSALRLIAETLQDSGSLDGDEVTALIARSCP